MIKAALAFFVFFLCGCSQLKPFPSCSQLPDETKLSVAEAMALSHAKSNFGQSCNTSDKPCRISLSRNKSKGIFVTVTYVYPNRDTGKCYESPGAEKAAIYDSNGTFLRQTLSL